jgi:hypothetical protein
VYELVRTYTQAHHDHEVMQSKGTPAENMSEIWREVKEFYEEHPCRDHYNFIKLSMFVDTADPHDKFPKLKGRAIEVRNLVPAMAFIWRMDEVLEIYPDADILPDDAAKEFSDASWMYAKLQNAVAHHYNKNMKLMVFDCTIKTHWTIHCAQQAPFLNPRKSWNFSGEDFMHKVKILMQSCVKGNTIQQSEVKFADKYAFALHLVFSAYEDELTID